MRVCGIICEYNPFHHGHAYHLSRARSLSGADYLVGVMSGSVTQRGVFARHDKWTRAHMALEGGCDLVLELSARFSCAPAPEFASGGVSLLRALGVVTHLSFGCEAESLPLLGRAAQAMAEESDAFRQSLRAHLDSGQPYPRARALAAQAASGIDNLAEIVSRPNAALAVEYLIALRASAIEPVPVVREGAGYHDTALQALSSATAVRAALKAGALDEAAATVPSPALLRQAEAAGHIHEEEALTQSLLYLLRTAKPAQLQQIAGMDEGLEHRFIAAARQAGSREDLLALVKSKRYTHARLSRICANVLLDITRPFAEAHRTPGYARILGFKKSAAPLMKAIKASAAVPLITKAADFDRADPLFALDVRAQDLWSLGCSAPALRRGGRDFTTGPVIL